MKVVALSFQVSLIKNMARPNIFKRYSQEYSILTENIGVTIQADLSQIIIPGLEAEGRQYSIVIIRIYSCMLVLLR